MYGSPCPFPSMTTGRSRQTCSTISFMSLVRSADRRGSKSRTNSNRRKVAGSQHEESEQEERGKGTNRDRSSLPPPSKGARGNPRSRETVKEERTASSQLHQRMRRRPREKRNATYSNQSGQLLALFPLPSRQNLLASNDALVRTDRKEVERLLRSSLKRRETRLLSEPLMSRREMLDDLVGRGRGEMERRRTSRSRLRLGVSDWSNDLYSVLRQQKRTHRSQRSRTRWITAHGKALTE